MLLSKYRLSNLKVLEIHTGFSLFFQDISWKKVAIIVLSPRMKKWQLYYENDPLIKCPHSVREYM